MVTIDHFPTFDSPDRSVIRFRPPTVADAPALPAPPAPLPPPHRLKMANSKPLDPIYIRAIAAELELLEAAAQPKAFSRFSGGEQPARMVFEALMLKRKHLLCEGYESPTFSIRAFTRTWMTDLLRVLDRCIEHEDMDTKCENAWQLAYVFCHPRMLTDKRLFHNAIRAVKMVASIAPALLWRIITLHATPYCPDWVDEIRFSMDYRAIMDAAATEEERADVMSIKARLVDYFDCNSTLDTPEEEDCKWLGMKVAEDEADEEEEDEEVKCACDGVPRAGCPVHGEQGNKRAVFQPQT